MLVFLNGFCENATAICVTWKQVTGVIVTSGLAISLPFPGSSLERSLGGGCIFIYSGSARLISFEMKLISKEVSWAELEYMNIHPPPSPPN